MPGEEQDWLDSLFRVSIFPGVKERRTEMELSESTRVDVSQLQPAPLLPTVAQDCEFALHF